MKRWAFLFKKQEKVVIKGSKCTKLRKYKVYSLLRSLSTHHGGFYLLLSVVLNK